MSRASSSRGSFHNGGGELFGFRRWVQRNFVGGELEDEEASPGTSAPEAPVALAHGSGCDVGEALGHARSLADKLLVLCLLDDGLRPLYARAAASHLHELKRDLVEALLSALRAGNDASADKPLSLDAHKELSEELLARLNAHIRSAVQEHCSELHISMDSWADPLLGAPGIPLALLPRQGKQETEAQASALRSKGGEASGQVLLGGIEFAPWHVPLKRRRQTMACVICTGLLPAAASVLFTSMYFWRLTWPVLVPYLAWAFLLDKSPWRGGMPIWHSLRGAPLWRWWAEYFPASLIKANPAADFSGERPILMGYHPHGILSFGAQVNICTDSTGWREKFPNLTPRVCTLNMNLVMPFLRELIGRLGAIPADAGAIRAALKPGNAVVLVVGGAAEALDTKPGEYVLTLARRTGFFKLALQHGVDLVPTFGFGENDLFEIIQPNSLLRAFQLKAYKVLSFSMPIFYGRGVFTYNMGMLPYRRPLTVVVGEPIRCEKTPQPSKEEIEALKSRYIAALRALHQEWAPRLEPDREASLIVL